MMTEYSNQLIKGYNGYHLIRREFHKFQIFHPVARPYLSGIRVIVYFFLPIWVLIGPQSNWVQSILCFVRLLIVEEIFFVAPYYGGVFLSRNSCSSWSSVSDSLNYQYNLSLIVHRDQLFWGTGGNDVWRRPLSEMIFTGIKNKDSNIPFQFVLQQNYPNPFNPSTSISFTLPSKCFVKLTIYDMIGRKVAMLLNREMPAGSHIQQWKADKISSGIYFYRLQAGSFTETKKLVLLR